MDDINWPAFFDGLNRAVLFHKVEGISTSFTRQHRQEIIVLLSMLNRVGLIGSPTSLHFAPPDHCDLCGIPVLNYQWFADCEHGEEGEWGSLCQPCFIERGGALGWGHGQLYLQTHSGEWRLVVGANPQDDQ
jgi:hypothetical protein